MSVKRIRDPAGLLGDRITVDFTDPKPDDFKAARSLIASQSPATRINRLRRHQQLESTADELAEWLRHSKGSAAPQLLVAIANAEYKALYLEAAQSAIEKRTRDRNQRKKVSEEQIKAAMIKCGTQEAAAEELGISVRQLSTRWKKIKNRKS
jgi:hypothetical protein